MTEENHGFLYREVLDQQREEREEAMEATETQKVLVTVEDLRKMRRRARERDLRPDEACSGL